MNISGRIALLMGGDSSEREISLKSGHAVLKALKSIGYDAKSIDVSHDLDSLINGDFEAAFIALHGTFGEDGAVQGLLEMLRLPYTGSGILASAATMNKAFAKKMMVSECVPTPEFQLFEDPVKDGVNVSVDYPLIVKPVSGGSTIGVSKVDKEAQLEKAFDDALAYGNDVLVEKFIEGREVTVGIINGAALPVIEVIPKKGMYDYEAKYTKGMTEYIVPAELDGHMEEMLTDISLRVYGLFGCRGAARVDFMIDPDDGPLVLEINTIPGMTEISLLPMAAAQAGIPFGSLVKKVLEGATLDFSTVPKADLSGRTGSLSKLAGIALLTASPF